MYSSFTQCCGAATFKVEPEPIFLLAGAVDAFVRLLQQRLHLFLASKKGSLVLVSNMT